MEALDYLALITDTADRIDAQWAMFVTIHLALLGGIIYVDRPLSKNERIMAILLYTMFAALNYAIIYVQQLKLNAMVVELVKLAKVPELASNELIKLYVAFDQHDYYEWRINLSVAIHIIAFVVVVLSIVYDKPVKKVEEDSNEQVKSE